MLVKNHLDGPAFYVRLAFSFTRVWMPLMANKPDELIRPHRWANYSITDVIQYRQFLWLCPLAYLYD